MQNYALDNSQITEEPVNVSVKHVNCFREHVIESEFLDKYIRRCQMIAKTVVSTTNRGYTRDRCHRRP